MNDKARILMCVTALPGDVSGAAKQGYMLADVLRRKDAAVIFLVLTEAPGTRKPWVKRIRYPDQDIYLVPCFRRRWAMPYTLLLGCVVLLALRNRYDIFHAHGGPRHFIWLGTFARCFGKTSIVKNTLVGYDSADVILSEFGPFMFRLYAGNAAIVCMTSEQERLALEAGIDKERVHRVPNGVDLSRFNPRPPAKKQGDGRVHLVSVGYMVPRKGFDHLIRVLARLVETGTDVDLRIVTHLRNMGEDSTAYLAELKQLRGSAGVEDRVYFSDDQDVPGHLRQADLFVFASRGEGFGTVQIEAMASGLPSVATRLPGVNTDIYRDGIDAYLVALDDVDEMVDKIAHLARHPDQREQMGQAARGRAESMFSLESVADQYLQLYGALKSSAGQ